MLVIDIGLALRGLSITINYTIEVLVIWGGQVFCFIYAHITHFFLYIYIYMYAYDLLYPKMLKETWK